MTPIFHFVFWAFLANLAIALLVATRRSDRPVNVAFLFLNVSIALWLGCMWIGIHQQSKASLDFWVRCTTGCALLMPYSLFLLARVSITGKNFVDCLLFHWPWLAVTAVGMGLCSTAIFMKGVEVPTDPLKMANPDYGAGFVAYVGWFILACVLTGVTIKRSRKNLTPIVRVELGYVTAGIVLFNLLVVGLAGVVPIFFQASQVIQFAVLWTVALDLVIAYGISTEKLLGLSGLSRRIASYLVLVAYLGGLYTLAWFCVSFLARKAGLSSDWGAYLVAAILMALSMRPAQSISSRIVKKLFVNSGTIDAEGGVRSIEAIRTEAPSIDQLAIKSLQIFAKAAGTDSGSIRLFSPLFDHRLERSGKDFLPISPTLLTALRGGPLVASLLPRQSREKGQLEKEMVALDAAIAIGIPENDSLQGVILLGERLTGKIYESDDVTALNLMTIHLASALSNARLYAEKIRSNIYQSTALDQLVSGVIAVDADANVTVLNKEAYRILAEGQALLPPKRLEHLPFVLREMIEANLAADIPVAEQEVILNPGTDNPIPLRVACRRFSDADGNLLGVSLTCRDISSIKFLQQQLIEADRLASLGQLAAIIAHEVKNPLVGIRTFAQLIPERLHDQAFLSEWSTLLNNEVERIDTITKQLLLWGKPSQRKMEAVFIEEILDGVTALYRLELRKRQIKVTSTWPQKKQAVLGDGQKLRQVFSNLVLNSIQAMAEGGELRLSVTALKEVPFSHVFDTRSSLLPPEAFVEVTLEDTGTGISQEEAARLFESTAAFISSKEGGSGFGLSIVKQIVSEHAGAIGLRPAQRGTTFSLIFPIKK